MTDDSPDIDELLPEGDGFTEAVLEKARSQLANRHVRSWSDFVAAEAEDRSEKMERQRAERLMRAAGFII